jgi:hypothetical protein
MLVALLDGDTAAAGDALRSLDRLGAGPTLSADGYGNRMLQFRYLDAVQRGDSALVLVLTDSLARDVAPDQVPDGSYYDPYRHGFFAQQVALSRAAAAAGGPPEWQRMHRLLLALSWGGRGAWDSALAGMDRLAAEGPDSIAALPAYGIAVLGTWLDALAPTEALARRPTAAGAASRDGVPGPAELAWLDGVLAVARKDRAGLAKPERRSAGRATRHGPRWIARWVRSMPRSGATFAEPVRAWRHWSGNRRGGARAITPVTRWSSRRTGWPRHGGWPLPATPIRLCACWSGSRVPT